MSELLGLQTALVVSVLSLVGICLVVGGITCGCLWLLERQRKQRLADVDASRAEWYAGLCASYRVGDGREECGLCEKEWCDCE